MSRHALSVVLALSIAACASSHTSSSASNHVTLCDGAGCPEDPCSIQDGKDACDAYGGFDLSQFSTCADPAHTDFCMFYDEDVYHAGCLNGTPVIEKCASKTCGVSGNDLNRSCLP